MNTRLTRSLASKLAQKVGTVSREEPRMISTKPKKRQHINIQSKVDDTHSAIGGGDQQTTKTAAPIKSEDSYLSHTYTTSKRGVEDVSLPSTKSKKIKWEPTSWKQQLQNIKEMRLKKDAPVDVMGCDKLSDENATPEVTIY